MTAETKLEQRSNVDGSMVVTLSGTIMEVKPEPMNAACPILETVSGKSIEDKFVQLLNANSPMLVILPFISMEERHSETNC